MSTKRLIVNADDFGQSHGTNIGIIKSHREGIVTSASLMVRYPGAAEAAEYANVNRNLGVGLHVDLGEWIFQDGEWRALYEVVKLDDIDSVREEIGRQLELFFRIMKRGPTHIDSHQHVHTRPLIVPIVKDLGKLLKINVRAIESEIKYCGDFYGQSPDGAPNHLAINSKSLQKVLETIPQGITELACHPGLENDIQTMYGIEREIEVSTLCNADIRNTITKQQIKLCSFKNLELIKF